MAIPNVTEAMRRWKQNTSNATEAYKAGVQGVTVSPTEAAAGAVDKWAAGVQRAKDQGTFVNGLQKVSLQDWKTAAATKGAARLASGVAAGEGKMQSFLTKWLPHQAAGQAMVKAMPSMTPEDRKQRMLRMFDHNAGFKS